MRKRAKRAHSVAFAYSGQAQIMRGLLKSFAAQKPLAQDDKRSLSSLTAAF
jgi:hypothetical protein